MADNVELNAGSGGVTAAADDIGGVHYPRAKLSLGADGAATDAVGNAGVVGDGVQRMTLASNDPAVTALQIIDDWDSTDAAKTVGSGLVAQLTLSLDTSQYSSGDLLADTQTVTVTRINDGRAILQSLSLIDEDDQKAALTIYFIQSANTAGSENSAPSISDANARDILGFVEVGVGDYKDLGGVSVASIKGIGLELEAVSGAQTIGVFVVNGTGTPTYTAAGLVLNLGLLHVD